MDFNYNDGSLHGKGIFDNNKKVYGQLILKMVPKAFEGNFHAGWKMTVDHLGMKMNERKTRVHNNSLMSNSGGWYPNGQMRYSGNYDEDLKKSWKY